MRALPRFGFSKGQSMLEAIVASGIIVTAVSSALTLVSSSINAEKESEALIVAGNLAREGVEVVRGLRDSNWLAKRNFDAGFSGLAEDHVGMPAFISSTNTWSIDFSPNAAEEPMARIYRYTENVGTAAEGLMVQSPTQPARTTVTPWSRTVTLDPICEIAPGNLTVAVSGSNCGAAKKIGVRVVTRVRWTLGGRIKNLVMEERMTDWR